MCGRFETNPTAEALVTTLKKHKVDLILDLETKKSKTENIVYADNLVDADSNFIR
jgi:hypothetical protein